MNIRKSLLVCAVSCFICSANALSIAFQIVQHEDAKSDPRISSYQIENGLFDFFFNKGIIVSNSPVLVSNDSGQQKLVLNESMIEAGEGGVKYFIEIVCEYDVTESTNPDAALLENFKRVTWKVVDLKNDRIIGSGENFSPDAKKYKNAEKGVKDFAYGIASDVYKIIGR